MTTYQRPVQLSALIYQSIVGSFKTPNISLLLGPPGIGKTESIPSIKEHLVSKNLIDEAGFIILRNEDDFQKLCCYVEGSMIPGEDCIYVDALDDTKFVDLYKRNSENFSKLRKFVVIDEFHNGLKPSFIATILEYGIPILVVSQGNIYNIKDVFYDVANLGDSLNPYIVLDRVNLAIECRVLTNSTFGFDAKIALANLPLLQTDSDGNISLIDEYSLSYSLYCSHGAYIDY